MLDVNSLALEGPLFQSAEVVGYVGMDVVFYV